jgi:hypothetical protein
MSGRAGLPAAHRSWVSTSHVAPPPGWNQSLGHQPAEAALVVGLVGAAGRDGAGRRRIDHGGDDGRRASTMHDALNGRAFSAHDALERRAFSAHGALKGAPSARYLGIGLLEALVMDLAIAAFYVAYAFLFNLAYDRAEGAPRPCMTP